MIKGRTQAYMERQKSERSVHCLILKKEKAEWKSFIRAYKQLLNRSYELFPIATIAREVGLNLLKKKLISERIV